MRLSKVTAAVAASVVLVGCAGGGGVPAWQRAETALGALRVGYNGLMSSDFASELPAGLQEEYETVTVTTGDLLDFGDDIVDTWQRQETEPPGWRGWVDKALEWSRRIVTILKDAGVEVPEVLEAGILAVQVLLPIILAAAGGGG